MSIGKESVEKNIKYMRMHCPTVDQVHDEGGLALVSEPVSKWAKAVVTSTNLQINEHTIRRKLFFEGGNKK